MSEFPNGPFCRVACLDACTNPERQEGPCENGMVVQIEVTGKLIGPDSAERALLVAPTVMWCMRFVPPEVMLAIDNSPYRVSTPESSI